MNKGKKHIALIVYEPPVYSETFFLSDIKIWEELGYEVKIYPSNLHPGYRNYKVVPPVYNGARLLSPFRAAFKALTFPGTIYRFCLLERKAGTSFQDILRKLWQDIHVLCSGADIVFFGYSSLAPGRENLAPAMKAMSILSIKGFDVAIYPFRKPGLLRLSFEKADKVHSVSKALAERAVEEGLPEGKDVHIIPAVVDPSRFPLKDDPGTLHQPLRILSIGRFHWKKGFVYAIEAMKILKEKGLSFRYEIFGSGEEEEKLKFSILQLGLEDSVFIKDKISHEAVSEKMRVSDIMLIPSLNEGVPNVGLEAQASGLLTILADYPGAGECVSDGETGWIVAKRNPEAIAGKIEFIHSLSPENRKKIALKASENILREFNPEWQKNRFRELLTFPRLT